MQNAWAIGSDQVLDWFNRVSKNVPYYSLWNGRQIVFSWSDDDISQGKDVLETNLRAFEEQGITDLFVLKLHPSTDKGGFITDKSPVVASLNFRPASQYNPAQMAGQEMHFPRNPGMQRLADEIKELREAREYQEPAQSDDPGILGAINKILSTPGVAEAVTPLIAGLSGFLLKSMGMPVPDPARSETQIRSESPLSNGVLSGISPDQDDKINQALDILEPLAPELGDDLLRLAALAQKDPAQFKMLLSMLRANG